MTTIGTPLSPVAKKALLCGCRMHGAVLRECSLQGADLRGADTTGCDLKSAHLQKTHLDIRQAAQLAASLGAIVE